MKIRFFIVFVGILTVSCSSAQFRGLKELKLFDSNDPAYKVRIVDNYESLPENYFPPNLAIRIYSKDGTVYPTSIIQSQGNVILWQNNNQNTYEPFLNYEWIKTKKLRIDLNNQSKIDWESHNPDKSLFEFRNKLGDYHLLAEIDTAFYTSFFIQKNTSILIRIYYDFLISSAGSTVRPEQKAIEYVCQIDNEGVIQLPIFFNSIETHTGTETGFKNPDLWYDATINSYKLKLIDNSCYQNKNCVTYSEAAKKISAFYKRRFNPPPNTSGLNNLIISIIPNKDISSITVQYKEKIHNLPYRKERINNYFNSADISLTLGLKKKTIRAVIISPYATLSTPDFKIKFKREQFSYSFLPYLLPGDKIYIY